MIRIGVLSDTHERLPSAILPALTGVDQIWHLGDVMRPAILAPLERLGKPLHVVRGNNDDYPWPMSLDFNVEGVLCHLVHIPPKVIPAGIHLLLHGHTHVPRDVIHGTVRILNPGTAGRPNKGSPESFAILEIEKGKVLSWDVRLVSKCK